MKVIKQYGWTKQSYAFDAQCENCGVVRKNMTGYPTDYYRDHSLPNMKCRSCGKSTNDCKEIEENAAIAR